MQLRLTLATCAILALAACSSSPATESASSDAAMPPASAATTTPPMMAQTCKADAAKQFVGQAQTPEVLEQARAAAGAKTVRLLAPDTMATMDFREDRLNVRTNADNMIASVDCG
ncbi:I78 family peptidase inhibitor [Noviluteimonas gilva]|uniref:Peptidase inhibitor I78 family protein n=1 Tax=Noviluteimonas gilva TaxID=2682097 RepID=A0A7C9HKR2_9GAMM|nr:I78 family peptidase inhibitor [Lysobacter gilvus]MUV13095.1 Elastase inhibitor AFLEI Flags: Precursor [Lysobacter gilvus]